MHYTEKDLTIQQWAAMPLENIHAYIRYVTNYLTAMLSFHP
jgi:hypothetical protein